MRNSWRSTSRNLLAETRGAEIAEAAAVLPLMFMMLLGIFWFGQAFSIYGAITRAAQEGARAGAAPTCATCSSANMALNAVNAATAALVSSKLDPTLARYPVPPPVFLPCTGGSPTCNAGASSNFCIQGPVQMTALSPGTTGVCGTSFSFQYPFQFWLPFTTLNQQKIWLSASARVRMETQ